MYPATQTYWLEAADLQQIGLRRYTRNSTGFSCAEGYHSALNVIGHVPLKIDENGRMTIPFGSDQADRRWPTQCEKCEYQFTPDDEFQDWAERLYRRSDTGEMVTLSRAEPGAMWDATWMPYERKYEDGIYLMVRCPNGRDWAVDSEASNCTRKGELHKCWVRHGDPQECRVTVDKNGDTCAAGAGSILAGDYHGFLQNGILTAG